MVLDLYFLEIDSIIAFFDPDIARLGDLSASFVIDTGKKRNRPAPIVKKTAQHQAYSLWDRVDGGVRKWLRSLMLGKQSKLPSVQSLIRVDFFISLCSSFAGQLSPNCTLHTPHFHMPLPLSLHLDSHHGCL